MLVQSLGHRLEGISVTSTDLQKIRDLLPGYLNKTLPASDQVFMDNWMREHSSKHPDLLHEMQWIELTRDQLRESTLLIHPEAGWHELLARIEATPRPSTQSMGSAPAVSWLVRWTRWLDRPAFTAMACVVVVAQTVTLWAIWPDSDDSVRLMSSTASGTATSGALIKVQIIFKDAATVTQMREAIRQVQGQITQGPSALGVWHMTVHQSVLDKSIQQLKAQAAVESVAIEP